MLVGQSAFLITPRAGIPTCQRSQLTKGSKALRGVGPYSSELMGERILKTFLNKALLEASSRNAVEPRVSQESSGGYIL